MSAFLWLRYDSATNEAVTSALPHFLYVPKYDY